MSPVMCPKSFVTFHVSPTPTMYKRLICNDPKTLKNVKTMYKL